MIIRLITFLLLIGVALAQDDLIVKTSYGSIRGYESASADGTRVRVFKSVPFAAPPVGDLRWKLPEKPEQWDGIKDGTKYSAACMSNSTTTKSPQPWVDEDCLYLNVFMPGECSSEKRCPIIVYYHGGGMNYDSATYFDDKVLLETYASRGVILVIPAFRLGFTGQFTLGDDLVAGNLGVHDALHALKFVKKEAFAFGGDPDFMTVMGHSFGGAVAISLAFSPVRKLEVPIHKFILMSPGMEYADPEINARLSKEMIQRAGCTNILKRVVLSCMRSKSGPELLAIQRKMEEEVNATEIFGGIQLRPPLLPFKSIPELLEHPPHADIAIGSTCTDLDKPYSTVGREIGRMVGARNVEELDEIYLNMTLSGKNGQTHTPKTQEIYMGVYLTARAVSEKGQKAFVYSFDQPTHNKHTDDLSYLMGIHGFEQDEHEKVIAKFYPELFINFTKFGEPSPEWKPFDSKDRYYSIAVDVNTGRMPEMRENYENETINFWTERAPKIDRMITVARAAGAKMQWDQANGNFRDLILEEDQSPVKNETLIPVILVHASYFPSFLLICGIFLLGIALGRYLLADSTSNEEHVWILGPDGRGFKIDPARPPAYTEQMF